MVMPRQHEPNQPSARDGAPAPRFKGNVFGFANSD